MLSHVLSVTGWTVIGGMDDDRSLFLLRTVRQIEWDNIKAVLYPSV